VTIHVGTGFVAVQNAVAVGGTGRICDAPDTVETTNAGRDDIVVVTTLAGFRIAVVVAVFAHVLLLGIAGGTRRITDLRFQSRDVS
jgi:hypothetical protein